MIADFLTKSLQGKAFQVFRDDIMGINQNSRGQGVVEDNLSLNRKVSNVILTSVAGLLDIIYSEGKGVIAWYIIAHSLDNISF